MVSMNKHCSRTHWEIASVWIYAWMSAIKICLCFLFPLHIQDTMSSEAPVFDSDMADAPPTEFNLPEHDPADDEVLTEIPVFLNTKLAKHMYIFQYPMRSIRFDSRSGPKAARIKPNANMVELDLPLDTRSAYYSTERGEDFAMGLNDKSIKTAYDKRMEEHEEEQMYGRSSTAKKEEELLDRMTFSSTEVPSQTNYVVGAMRDGMCDPCIVRIESSLYGL